MRLLHRGLRQDDCDVISGALISANGIAEDDIHSEKSAIDDPGGVQWQKMQIVVALDDKNTVLHLYCIAKPPNQDWRCPEGLVNKAAPLRCLSPIAAVPGGCQ